LNACNSLILKSFVILTDHSTKYDFDILTFYESNVLRYLSDSWWADPQTGPYLESQENHHGYHSLGPIP
jgi:hypothetical protein